MTITAPHMISHYDASHRAATARAYDPSPRQDDDHYDPPPREERQTRPTPTTDLAGRIRSIGHTGTLRAAYETGQLVAEHQRRCGRDGATRRGVKHEASYRQLSRLPSMPLSPASLCRCVQIYELAQKLPELLRFQHVGVGHVAEVLGLDLEEQRSLLVRAEAFRWSRPVLRRQRIASRRPCAPALVLSRDATTPFDRGSQ